MNAGGVAHRHAPLRGDSALWPHRGKASKKCFEATLRKKETAPASRRLWQYFSPGPQIRRVILDSLRSTCESVFEVTTARALLLFFSLRFFAAGSSSAFHQITTTHHAAPLCSEANEQRILPRCVAILLSRSSLAPAAEVFQLPGDLAEGRARASAAAAKFPPGCWDPHCSVAGGVYTA